MSIFCPSQTDSTCQNDAAIDLLGKIFGDGFIQAFVLGKSAAATAPATGELTPVLFGALGHLALVFAAFLFLFLVLLPYYTLHEMVKSLVLERKNIG